MPIRTCAACRRKREKSELLRWTVAPEGFALPDPWGRRPGRGGYVCRNERCYEILRKGSRGRGPDFRREETAFRLAISGGVIQNVPGELYEK